LNLITIELFLKFFEDLINSKYPETDLEPEGQLITDPPDPDPQHCKKSMYNKILKIPAFYFLT
jgi:hypothetical protein